MAKAKKRPTPPCDTAEPIVPPLELWQTPLSWIGNPPCPIGNFRAVPRNATFTRAEMVFSQTGQSVPALVRLENEKPLEVHAIGLDGKAWTLRQVAKGRKSSWVLFVDIDFPARQPASSALRAEYASELEYIVVQTLLPLDGGKGHIPFQIQADGEMQDLLEAAREEGDVDD